MKKRNYYFDILRIIAMAMIITHHITVNDFELQPNLNGIQTIASNKQLLVLMIINSFVIIGVNLFFLISGYFRIKFDVKKLISLIIEVYIIYDLVTVIGILLNFVLFDKNTIHNLIFPFDLYWFLCAYVGLMVISPFLNKVIESITKEDKKLIILSILLFSLYAYKHDNGLVINGGYSFIWAIIMYIVGGLINKFKIKTKKGILVYFISGTVLSILAYIFYKLGTPSKSWGLYKYNNILILIESIGIFTWVNSWSFKIKNKKLINSISFLGKNTLMVYLLHSTCWLTVLRRLPVLKLVNMGYFKLGILLFPIYVLIIYVVCASISHLYNISIQKIINKVFLKNL